jgi:hypothetical protein
LVFREASGAIKPLAYRLEGGILTESVKTSSRNSGAAQDTRVISSVTAKAKRPRPVTERRQHSLLLPVAGGRKRKKEPATIAVRPRKKA